MAANGPDKKGMAMNETYQVDDTILYGINGVCRVVEIARREFDGKNVDYYVLQPVYSDQSLIYVPMNNEALTSRMRRVLSREQVDHLIDELPYKEADWIENENERRETFRRALSKAEPDKVAKVIKCIYEHREELQTKGKKLRQADERIFHEAEKILYSEFALVLHMEPDQVQPFILERVRAAQRRSS